MNRTEAHGRDRERCKRSGKLAQQLHMGRQRQAEMFSHALDKATEMATNCGILRRRLRRVLAIGRWWRGESEEWANASFESGQSWLRTHRWSAAWKTAAKQFKQKFEHEVEHVESLMDASDKLHHQLNAQRVTWDALKEANAAVCAERDELRGQLAEAREVLHRKCGQMVDSGGQNPDGSWIEVWKPCEVVAELAAVLKEGECDGD